MEFNVEIIRRNYGSNKNGISNDEYFSLIIDAPDISICLEEVRGLCDDIKNIQLDSSCELPRNNTPLPQYYEIRGKVLGIEVSSILEIDEKLYYATHKTTKQPEKPKLNEESLQNDIMYGIDMIKSVTPNLHKNVEMIGVINWQWHILNKHLGLVIPEEIKNLTTDFGKDDLHDHSQ